MLSLFTPPLPPLSTLFPYTTLFRSAEERRRHQAAQNHDSHRVHDLETGNVAEQRQGQEGQRRCHGRHRSEEHTSELQSLTNLVCRLLLEKKKMTLERRQWRVARAKE